MADQPPRPPAQPRGRAQPPAPGQQGWRVTPAPDGRGARQNPVPPSSPRSRWWIAAVIVVVLLAINLWVSSQALKPNAPIRVPYSPTFLNQVQANNVSAISSTGDAISGTLKKAIAYPQESPAIEHLVSAAKFPPSFVGVVIATLVMLPETLAAGRAARQGRIQTSLNLAYGSSLASIGLTIPAIALALALAAA